MFNQINNPFCGVIEPGWNDECEDPSSQHLDSHSTLCMTLLISQNLGLLLHKMGIVNPTLEGEGTN